MDSKTGLFDYDRFGRVTADGTSVGIRTETLELDPDGVAVLYELLHDGYAGLCWLARLAASFA